MIYLIAAGAVVFFLLITLIVSYNKLVKARNQVNEAFSTMDVQLQKRFQLIPNLVRVVKGYTDHESRTLEELTRLRSTGNMLPEMAERDRNVTQTLRQFRVQLENYPDLKADTLFNELMNELSLVEDDLLFSRRYYNGSVRALNNIVESFPANIAAGLFGFKTRDFYEALPEERTVPNTSTE